MIVITGPGRSGTTFLADLYRRLKFDPGGGWDKKIRAGREHHEVVEVNDLLTKELKAPVGPPPTEPLGAQRWDLVSELADRHGERIREIAGSLPVAKDPRFAWTLRVWLEAKAPIEHVVLTLRRVDDLIGSAHHAGMARPKETIDDWNRARTALVYRIGSAITSVGDYRVPHSILWFPDYLSKPQELYEELVFPSPVSWENFLRAFKKVMKPDLVHFGTQSED